MATTIAGSNLSSPPTSLPAAPESNPLERALKRERKARKRAEELLEARSRELYTSKKALEGAYSATVEVFASLVGGKSGRSSESLRRLGRSARKLARQIGLDDERSQTTYLAAILCDLGKLALPDEIVEKPVMELSRKEREQFSMHPRLAYEALIALEPLEAVATTILQHCELFDGSGYPGGLTWDEIPEESQVLCVVKDFDGLKNGILLTAELTEAEAVEYLESHKNKRYGPRIVDAFVAQIQSAAEENDSMAEQRLTPASLREGLILTRDLVNDKGALILPAGQRLSTPLIEKLRRLSEDRDVEILLYVEPERPDEDPVDVPPAVVLSARSSSA